MFPLPKLLHFCSLIIISLGTLSAIQLENGGGVPCGVIPLNECKILCGTKLNYIEISKETSKSGKDEGKCGTILSIEPYPREKLVKANNYTLTPLMEKRKKRRKGEKKE